MTRGRFLFVLVALFGWGCQGDPKTAAPGQGGTTAVPAPPDTKLESTAPGTQTPQGTKIIEATARTFDLKHAATRGASTPYRLLVTLRIDQSGVAPKPGMTEADMRAEQRMDATGTGTAKVADAGGGRVRSTYTLKFDRAEGTGQLKALAQAYAGRGTVDWSVQTGADGTATVTGGLVEGQDLAVVGVTRPGRAVKVGDTWDARVQLMTGPVGRTKAKLVTLEERNGKEVVRLELTGFEQGALSATAPVTVLIEVKTGLIVYSRIVLAGEQDKTKLAYDVTYDTGQANR